jgi:hypothetical protein
VGFVGGYHVSQFWEEVLTRLLKIEENIEEESKDD